MKRRSRVLVAALVLLVAGAAVYVLADSPIGGVAALLGERGDRMLREPLRPPRGGTRVLVFALDGVGEDELLRVIRSGAAPAIAAAAGYGEDGFTHGYAATGVLSILPSTTVAAWTSVFTGEPPARTGVPGNEWYVREQMRFYAPAPVSISDMTQALAVYTDALLDSVVAVPTVYEHANVRSYVALSQVHRGADVLVLPDLGVLGDLVLAAVKGVADGDDFEKETYSRLDRAAVDQLIDTLDRYGVPDLQVVYFPGVDLYTHVAEHALPQQLDYLAEVLDPAIARITDAYRRAGVLEDTWIVFVSDHGHTPVLPTDRNALGSEGPDEPPALIEQLGFRMRAAELDPEPRDYQAVVAYQGAMAYVYLADRSTCAAPGTTCNWMQAPRLEEDVLPLVRAFDAANRSGAGVPALQGTLDLILARDPRPVGTDALPFDVWDGNRLVPIGDYLAATPRPDLLDFEARMRGLAAGPRGHRAGDILLLARSGTGRPLEDRYYFSSEYRSWHGSPTAQDSRIPLLVARAGTAAADVEAAVTAAIGRTPSQLDVARLILALLAGDR